MFNASGLVQEGMTGFVACNTDVFLQMDRYLNIYLPNLALS